MFFPFLSLREEKMAGQLYIGIQIQSVFRCISFPKINNKCENGFCLETRDMRATLLGLYYWVLVCFM